MSRNLKREYIKKLAGIETANGYKVDVANYLHNPSFDHEYPNPYKTIEKTETSAKISVVYYFKHYNGNGEYLHKIYTYEKEDPTETWSICHTKEENIIESSNRFNMNRLIKLAETF